MEKVFKTVQSSETTLTELMIPAYANFGGKIHGGIILSLMDKVAYACAARHAECYCVTVSVNGVEFLEPVNVGELVSMHATVRHVGTTSLVIGIKVTSENLRTKEIKHTNTSYFTMVAKDDDGKPTTVPGLILETEQEVRYFIESIKRKKLIKYFREQLHKYSQETDVKNEIYMLEGERCEVTLNYFK